METGQGHSLFRLELFVVLERGDLHLRTLQGWQVLHFTFESAHCKKDGVFQLYELDKSIVMIQNILRELQ
jgi:hypothetical protein